eukprot:SAG25_NODE_266_length_10666_cov_14.508943_10_plen_238_part_00
MRMMIPTVLWNPLWQGHHDDTRPVQFAHVIDRSARSRCGDWRWLRLALGKASAQAPGHGKRRTPPPREVPDPQSVSACQLHNLPGALTFDRGCNGQDSSNGGGGADGQGKQNPQRLDNSRVINFHLPGLVKGSYSRNGTDGRGRVAKIVSRFNETNAAWNVECARAAAELMNVEKQLAAAEAKVVRLERELTEANAQVLEAKRGQLAAVRAAKASEAAHKGSLQSKQWDRGKMRVQQ